MQKCYPPEEKSQFLHKIKICGFHGLKITHICRSISCTDKSLLCNKCMHLHERHQKESVEDFFNEEMPNYAYRIHNGVDYKTLRETEQNLKNDIREMKTDIIQKLNSLEQVVDKQFEILQEKLKEDKNKSAAFKYDHIDNEAMQHIFSLIDITHENQWVYSLKQDFMPLIKTTENKILRYLLEVKQCIQKCELHNEQVRQEQLQAHIQVMFPEIKSQFWLTRFSQTLKHPAIDIKFHNLEAQHKDNDKQYRMVLLNKKLTAQNQLRVFFQINQKKSPAFLEFHHHLVGIGVCLRDSAQRMGFQFQNIKNTGIYMLTSDGKPHKSRDIPHQHLYNDNQVHFNKGDIVEMWIQFESNLLCFRKKSNHEIRYKIALPETKHKYYPFIAFKGKQLAKVSLVSVKKHTQQIAHKRHIPAQIQI